MGRNSRTPPHLSLKQEKEERLEREAGDLTKKIQERQSWHELRKQTPIPGYLHMKQKMLYKNDETRETTFKMRNGKWLAVAPWRCNTCGRKNIPGVSSTRCATCGAQFSYNVYPLNRITARKEGQINWVDEEKYAEEYKVQQEQEAGEKKAQEEAWADQERGRKVTRMIKQGAGHRVEKGECFFWGGSWDSEEQQRERERQVEWEDLELGRQKDGGGSASNRWFDENEDGGEDDELESFGESAEVTNRLGRSTLCDVPSSTQSTRGVKYASRRGSRSESTVKLPKSPSPTHWAVKQQSYKAMSKTFPPSGVTHGQQMHKMHSSTHAGNMHSSAHAGNSAAQRSHSSMGTTVSTRNTLQTNTASSTIATKKNEYLLRQSTNAESKVKVMRAELRKVKRNIMKNKMKSKHTVKTKVTKSTVDDVKNAGVYSERIKGSMADRLALLEKKRSRLQTTIDEQQSWVDEMAEVVRERESNLVRSKRQMEATKGAKGLAMIKKKREVDGKEARAERRAERKEAEDRRTTYSRTWLGDARAPSPSKGLFCS
jgi:hypothetical protein